MSSILHISYDIGRGGNNDKTSAVSNLIEETKKISDVIVIDVSRVNSFRNELSESEKNYLKVDAFGLPYGIFHKYHLNRVYEKICKAEDEGNIKLLGVNLIHAHKLTFDGYIGYRISVDKKIPLIVTLRQTDLMVLKKRTDLRILYKNIIKHCSRFVYLVPSIVNILKEILGQSFFEKYIGKKLVYIPNIIKNQPDYFKNEVDDDAPLITILRLNKRSVYRKNLKNLIKAAAGIKDVNFHLNIIGGGDYLPVVKQWVTKYRLGKNISFIGPVDNTEINKYYSSAKAFILPSFSESFGFVYAESLLNGTPILYSRGVPGFDGVYENVGCAVDPFSVESIKNGIKDIIKNNSFYRLHIKKLKEETAFRIFSSDYAYETYLKMYKELMSPAPVQSTEHSPAVLKP